MKRYIVLILSLTFAHLAMAHIHGVVLSDEGEPLTGANVYWANSSQGVATDFDGSFEIEPLRGHTDLVASFLGYRPDTIHITSSRQDVTFVLINDMLIDEVSITERRVSVIRSRIDAFDTQRLGSDELCKAACCNLSESFETSASVDVAYSDAATGAKQIRLLGLSGTYVQLLSENTPGVRGLAQNFGMEYIPGPWMESIQVSKGTSSVVNGYEATTGQINVEFLKPQTQDPISVNLMLNSELHGEVNIEGGWQIPTADSVGKLHTGILAHYQGGFLPMDDNKDGFLDMPLSQQGNLINRWNYKTDQYTFMALVRGLYDQRLGGRRTTDMPYNIDLRTWRVDGYIKNGYVFDQETGSSIGIITAASYHDQVNHYGQRSWIASQANAYLNALYQTNIEGDFSNGIDNDHKITAGISLNYDRYQEQVELASDTTRLHRWEITPGIFAEYTLRIDEWLSLVAGVRADYSNRYGFFMTPRLNLRVSPWEWWTLRTSVGLGYRSPNVISDNAQFMPSSRALLFHEGTHYFDLYEQERALNVGASTTFYIPIAERELQITGEYYYTRFLQGVIIDMDQDVHSVHFLNIKQLGGQSFSHNAQIEATMEILRGWTMTAAFRYTDVKQTTYRNGVLTLRDKPLTNKYKAVITTSYQTPLKKWQFDFTAQFKGGGRMPDGLAHMEGDNTIIYPAFASQWNTGQYHFGHSGSPYLNDGSLYYKWYPQLMAQITKYWRTCSLYVGAENMTNFKQENPILSADQPYGTDFDASMTWGPTTGWKVYVGFRWSLDRED